MRIDVTFSEHKTSFVSSFTHDKHEQFSAEFGQVTVVKVPVAGDDVDIYEGPYLVDPTFNPQRLHTQNKTMLNDVTVNAIRVERMTNSHGTTVYIGMKGD